RSRLDANAGTRGSEPPHGPEDPGHTLPMKRQSTTTLVQGLEIQHSHQYLVGGARSLVHNASSKRHVIHLPLGHKLGGLEDAIKTGAISSVSYEGRRVVIVETDDPDILNELRVEWTFRNIRSLAEWYVPETAWISTDYWKHRLPLLFSSTLT